MIIDDETDEIVKEFLVESGENLDQLVRQLAARRERVRAALSVFAGTTMMSAGNGAMAPDTVAERD